MKGCDAEIAAGYPRGGIARATDPMVPLALYPIVTLQYSSTTLYHIP
jgi:hypothetical protein